ncbi:MAG: ABC transporter ATP-binding protein [Acidimicrobiia bacterium]|nr:ABC transporter ATP-binding protein [Acidimicrobiia bacterium]
MAVIEVDDLVVRYGPVTAVDRITFSADRGQVVALLGPNGAGKTSTIETLEGYRRPTEGHVRVLGLDPVADHDRLTRSIGVMLQGGGIYPGIRAHEVLTLFAAFHPEPEDPDVLLERVGLTHRRRALWRTLSGGEQQRLALAIALVGRPEVFFLDEPTAGIDATGRQVVRQVIDELRAGGACVLVTTHDLHEAERIADRVVIVDRGHIVADGSPGELMEAPGSPEIHFGAPAGLDTASLAAALGAPVEEVTPGEYLVRAEGSPATVASLTAWLAERDLPLADLRAGRQRLEDVFLRLTSES